jgi:hypothetical protein
VPVLVVIGTDVAGGGVGLVATPSCSAGGGVGVVGVSVVLGGGGVVSVVLVGGVVAGGAVAVVMGCVAVLGGAGGNSVVSVVTSVTAGDFVAAGRTIVTGGGVELAGLTLAGVAAGLDRFGGRREWCLLLLALSAITCGLAVTGCASERTTIGMAT